MGFTFLFKYLLYFLRLISPLSSKSVATQLNISKDKGPVFISDGDESNQKGIFIVVEGFLAVI